MYTDKEGMCNEYYYTVIDTMMQTSCASYSYSDGLALFLTISICDVDVIISCSYFSQEDSDPAVHESLSIENTLWASTVVASGKGCNSKAGNISKNFCGSVSLFLLCEIIMAFENFCLADY